MKGENADVVGIRWQTAVPLCELRETKGKDLRTRVSEAVRLFTFLLSK